jgi:hypothetical protein
LLRIIFNITLFLSLAASSASAQNVTIYADVRGNDTLQNLVNILTGQLKKSGSFSFSVQPASSYQGKGIYLSTASVSRMVKPSAKLLNAGVEGFSIDANDQTVQILGNSNMAVGHAIFSYLDFLGYRYYFANSEWHIIPSRLVLFKKWNIVSSPVFYHRRIWYGYGTGSKKADDDYNFWVLANRLGGTINASFGHAYEDIALRNKDVFLQHPEWFYPVAPKGVIPDGAKFDMSHEDLVQVVTHDVEKRIGNSLRNKTNEYKMISLAPSDGPGTCNTPACQKLGTVTDRVYYLVNRVAKAIQKKYPSTLIGCLAYGEYIAPPTKNVEPNVFVGITMAFNTSKYSTEQLVELWRKKGAVVGLYNYFSWYAWDQDLPGQSHVSRPTEVVNTIKKYRALGVKAYEGESSQGWISKGLGYYLAAKAMWDGQADVAATRKEFFRLCFMNAAPAMEKLWNEWEKYSFTMVRENDLAHWIDYTTQADELEKNPAVQRRLFQVRSYLHYLALYRIYQANRSEANLVNLLNYGYRKLDDGSVAGFPAFFELGNRSGIEGMAYSDKAKWRFNPAQVTEQELDNWIANDRRSLKTTKAIKETAPAVRLSTVPGIDRYKTLTAGADRWEDKGWFSINEWVIQVKTKGDGNYIEYSGNHLSNTPEIKPARINIYPYQADGNVSGLQPAFSYEYDVARVRKKISLSSLKPGFYTVIVEDPSAFVIGFSPSINFSQVVRASRPVYAASLNAAFIYVPEGTKYFNVTTIKTIEFITPTGRTIAFPNSQKPEDLQIEVLKGEAGLWRVKLYDKVFFEGIPPFISTSPERMLVPAN